MNIYEFLNMNCFIVFVNLYTTVDCLCVWQIVPKTDQSATYDEIEVDTEEEVEETVEKEVMQDVVQEVKVPQVKALYPYKGQGLVMSKGEVRNGDSRVQNDICMTFLIPNPLPPI